MTANDIFSVSLFDNKCKSKAPNVYLGQKFEIEKSPKKLSRYLK